MFTEFNIYLSIAAVFSYLISKYQIGVNNSWWLKALITLPYVAVAPAWVVWLLLHAQQYM
ncbi:hypothetical protein [Vibrio phage MZH0603]|nr:hypothetical protein [Vibrio phage MZH0603]